MSINLIIDERGFERWLDNFVNVNKRRCRVSAVKMKNSASWLAFIGNQIEMTPYSRPKDTFFIPQVMDHPRNCAPFITADQMPQFGHASIAANA